MLDGAIRIRSAARAAALNAGAAKVVATVRHLAVATTEGTTGPSGRCTRQLVLSVVRKHRFPFSHEATSRCTAPIATSLLLAPLAGKQAPRCGHDARDRSRSPAIVHPKGNPPHVCECPLKGAIRGGEDNEQQEPTYAESTAESTAQPGRASTFLCPLRWGADRAEHCQPEDRVPLHEARGFGVPNVTEAR